MPEFLSAHMTCTCGYTLRGCIHLSVYSQAPAHHQPVPHQTRSHSGQPRDGKTYILLYRVLKNQKPSSAHLQTGISLTLKLTVCLEQER